MPLSVMFAVSRTVCDVEELIADRNADALDTSTVVDEPPVVPPFCVAQPTRPVDDDPPPEEVVVVVARVVVVVVVVRVVVVVPVVVVVGRVVVVVAGPDVVVVEPPPLDEPLTVKDVGTGFAEVQLPWKPNEVLAPVASEPL
jgi:hypothetical protein